MSREPLTNGTVLRFPDGQECQVVRLLGGGGSALLYEVKILGSELYAAVKEVFPARGYVRKEGQIRPSVPLPRKEKELQRRKDALSEQETLLSQKASRTNHHVLFLQPPVWHRAGLRLPDGRLFPDVENTYARMDSLAEKGTPLARLVRAGSLSLDEALSVMETVLDAYAALHEDGFLHGDCQISNLFLLKAGREAKGPGTACIIDFGSARELGEDGLTAPVTDEIFSTDGYCAPELMFPRGEELRLSAAADVWSLGFLLLNLLTDRGLEELDGITEYLMLHPEEKVLTHAEAAALGCSPAQEHLLNHILTRALANEPDGRYPHAGAMREDLRRLMRCRALDPSRGIDRYLLWEAAWRHQRATPSLFRTEHVSRLAEGLPPLRLNLKGRCPDTDPVPVGWLLQGMEQQGENAYLYGAGGAGKSFATAPLSVRWVESGERIPLYLDLAACTAEVLEGCGGNKSRVIPTLLAKQYFGRTDLGEELKSLLEGGETYFLLLDNLHKVDPAALPAVLVILNGLYIHLPEVWTLVLGRAEDPGAPQEQDLPQPALIMQRVQLLPLTTEEMLRQVRSVRSEGLDFAAGTTLLKQAQTLRLPLFLMRYLELLALGQEETALPNGAMELLHSYFALQEYRSGGPELHALLREQLPWVAQQYGYLGRATCSSSEISLWLRERFGQDVDCDGFFRRAVEELAVLERDNWDEYRFVHDCYQEYFAALFAADCIRQAIARRTAGPMNVEDRPWTTEEARRRLELCCLTVREGRVVRTRSEVDVLRELLDILQKLRRRELLCAGNMIANIFQNVISLLREGTPGVDKEMSRRLFKLQWRSSTGRERLIMVPTLLLTLISLLGNPVITQLRALCTITEDGMAEYQLACRYKHGNGVRTDPKKANRYLNQSVRKGYPPALNAKGELEEETGRYDRAMELYRKAAEKQYPRAVWHLGGMHLNGRGMPRNPFEAFKLFKQAARDGDGLAQYDYGQMLAHGWGGEEGRAEALHWLDKAAAQGNEAAQKAAEELRSAPEN